MTIILETTYKHGELFAAMESLGWNAEKLSKESKLTRKRVLEILHIRSRPNHDERNVILQAFARAGICLDLEYSWPPNFVGTDKVTKKIGFDVIDEDYLMSFFPPKRLLKLAKNSEVSPADRIDVKFFLSELKKTFNSTEVLIVRLLLEGEDDAKLGAKYSKLDIVNIRRKVFKLARRLEVDYEDLREILAFWPDYKYASETNDWRSFSTKTIPRSVNDWMLVQLPKEDFIVSELGNKVRIAFSKKPSQALIEQLRRCGWSWDRESRAWYNRDKAAALSFAQTLTLANDAKPDSETSSEIAYPYRQEDLF